MKNKNLMIVYTSIAQIEPITSSCGITIGVFDAIHLGHQKLFKRLNNLSSVSIAITFKENPLKLLYPDRCLPAVLDNGLRLEKFKESGIDIVIMLPFTKHLSLLPYDTFLQKIHKKLPFKHLVLGKGATFGKNREGNKHNVERFSKELGFNVEYISKVHKNDILVSSSNVRRAILCGNLRLAKSLLGRPYSLSMPLMKTPKLCLPPDGTYPVEVIQNGRRKKAVLEIHNNKAYIQKETCLNNRPLVVEFI